VHYNKGWLYAVNDAFLRTKYPFHSRLETNSVLSPRFQRVYHIIRCPMSQISAVTSHLPETYRLFRKFIFKSLLFTESPDTLFNTNVSRNSSMIWFAGREGCPRGDKCNLHLASIAWIVWNKHIQRYQINSASYCSYKSFLFYFSYAHKSYRTDEIEKLISDVCEFLRSIGHPE
jgi:hypothetical protein